MEIVFLRQAHRFIWKAKRPLKKCIKAEVLLLLDDPKRGKLLKGKLKGIRSYKFQYESVQYRIAYRVEGDLIVIMIASRENFYRDLR